MLRAAYEQLQPSLPRSSFLLRVFGEEAFDAPYHFHPEYELTLIVRGEGRRYAGSNMASFSGGDLVLLGPNLPHCWKLDPLPQAEKGSAIVIQFAPGFLGNEFFSVPEMLPALQILHQSTAGLAFTGKTRELASAQIVELAGEADHFSRLTRLLELLNFLAGSNEYSILNREAIPLAQSPVDRERINAVFAYLVDNFKNEISLNEAAAIISMTPNAFCKYFKRITRKTFFEMVMEYRLSWAARELAQTDKTVTAVCFDSGFRDLSHFNKTFKSKMKMSPLHYRKKFKGKE